MSPKKKLLEEAKAELEHCTRMLKAHQRIWDDVWDAQPNPFLKVREYTSKAQRAKRKIIIDPWIAAKAQVANLAKSTSKEPA